MASTSPGNIAGDDRDDELWSLFHENSKSSRQDPVLPNEYVVARMLEMWDVLPYEGYEKIALPDGHAALDCSVRDALLARRTARAMTAGPISLADFATLLQFAYGVTRNNDDGSAPRPFRAVPSAGGMYPLELYAHASNVAGLGTALYHFNARERNLDLLLPGDSSRQIGAALMQPDLALESSLVIFITAVFERAVFKYGNRGYRFSLLEAGHVAQNVNLVAASLGLASVNIGAFMDRDIDNLLRLDGVSHSTLYLVAVGRHAMTDSAA